MRAGCMRPPFMAALGPNRPDLTKPTNPLKHPTQRFFQNQIKSEEEFQARKSELRAAARRRLDEIFAKKGRRLAIDSDADAFSIDSSELSAWDSDVASIGSLSSCVREWREEARFGAPAAAALQLGLMGGVVSRGASLHACMGWGGGLLGACSTHGHGALCVRVSHLPMRRPPCNPHALPAHPRPGTGPHRVHLLDLHPSDALRQPLLGHRPQRVGAVRRLRKRHHHAWHRRVLLALHGAHGQALPAGLPDRAAAAVCGDGGAGGAELPHARHDR